MRVTLVIFLILVIACSSYAQEAKKEKPDTLISFVNMTKEIIAKLDKAIEARNNAITQANTFIKAQQDTVLLLYRDRVYYEGRLNAFLEIEAKTKK